MQARRVVPYVVLQVVTSRDLRLGLQDVVNARSAEIGDPGLFLAIRQK